MLRVRIKIGGEDGAVIHDSTDYGLIYISADNRFAPDTKGFETTSYPEEEGEHILPKTVDDAFDYKVKFCIDASGGVESANAKIAAFNNLLYELDDAGNRVYKEVYFYNDYKKVLIVGYPSPISNAETFWRDSKGEAIDVVVVEWNIRVTTPSKCNFNLT